MAPAVLGRCVPSGRPNPPQRRRGNLMLLRGLVSQLEPELEASGSDSPNRSSYASGPSLSIRSSMLNIFV
eukprot:CAMPEP_0113728510 /NCGR_PEP_ID=MMETSP0038_2-20120614/41935_1 /TAXON_ID=2898 /ORGANISM="Cryptomonas paramecium" /LENGTH=69 /DNA_ID=CAMNT_0000660051 /DNA_START=82 /DNA_END=291 /DNA_ORIENTATION=+ /assembly_acc=CAM_ASM_000170